MTNARKIEIVTRYINGETPEELGKAYGVSADIIRHVLTHIYKRRPSGKRIDEKSSALPHLARWINETGHTGAWLASRMGISKQQVSHYFRGLSQVKPWRKAQICEITGLTMEQAFGPRKEA